MRTVCHEFSEPYDTPSFSDESVFKIKSGTFELAVIFRILAGTCGITNLNSNDTAELNINYFFSDHQENSERNLDFLNSFQEGLALIDYGEYIRKNAHSNRKFYKPFLGELATAIYCEQKCSHTAAFVHVYRTYEHMAYAFPMIYASKTNDYVGTFENLRKWLSSAKSDENVGELKFHKAFVCSLFSEQPEISSTIDIHISSREEHKELIFDALCKKVLDWKTPDKFTGGTVRPSKISVNFVDFHSFLVNTRNRFFHYSNARADNLGIDEVIDSEMFFSMINKTAISYIAKIFHEVVTYNMSKALPSG